MNVTGPTAPFPRVPSGALPGARPRAETAPAAAADRGEAAPTLWDLLTPEERDFFTQQLQLGPLSYRPGGAVRAPEAGAAPTGQRIDVRG